MSMKVNSLLIIPPPQRQAKACVQECHPQKLFTDSKYLREESLTELVQWLIQLSSGPHAHAKNKTEYSEYSSAVFIGERLVTHYFEKGYWFTILLTILLFNTLCNFKSPFKL